MSGALSTTESIRLMSRPWQRDSPHLARKSGRVFLDCVRLAAISHLLTQPGVSGDVSRPPADLAVGDTYPGPVDAVLFALNQAHGACPFRPPGMQPRDACCDDPILSYDYPEVISNARHSFLRQIPYFHV